MPQYVTGVQAVMRTFKTATANVNRTIKDSLERCGGVVLRKANFYVPKDTLALMNSGRVVTTGRAFGAKSAVIYGLGTTEDVGLMMAAGGSSGVDYALYVHEDLTKQHAEPTCAKFLERAERETRGTCVSILRRDLNAAIEFAKDGKGVP